MHLLVSLSPHGFGHAAMTAPVVNALRARLPRMRLTLQTTLPAAKVAERYRGHVALLRESAEACPVMAAATRVDVAATAAAFSALHARLDEAVEAEAARLRSLGVDMVLSNVSYIALAAARRAGIPAAAFSCLNWAGIYQHLCGDRPEAPAVLAGMLEAYDAARVFLRPAPAMPMPELARVRDVGMVAEPGRARRRQLRQALDLPDGARVGLVAFGGFDVPLALEAWPRHEGWHWLVPPAACPRRGDMSPWEAPGMSFPDMMASCDLLLAKPGYGTFAEAAALGLPVIYVPRDDWPEAPHLVAWLRARGGCVEVPEEAVRTGAFAAALADLTAAPPPEPVAPTGNAEAAAILADLAADAAEMEGRSA